MIPAHPTSDAASESAPDAFRLGDADLLLHLEFIDGSKLDIFVPFPGGGGLTMTGADLPSDFAARLTRWHAYVEAGKCLECDQEPVEIPAGAVTAISAVRGRTAKSVYRLRSADPEALP